MEKIESKEQALALIGQEISNQDLNLEQLGATLTQMKFTEADEVTSEYQKIEEGEELKCFFVEMTKINKIGGEPGEKSDAVRLLLPEGSFAINADAVIVSTCRGLARLQPIAIQCTGKKGPKGREYKTFKVFKLK
jgi:hypothetical protein